MKNEKLIIENGKLKIDNSHWSKKRYQGYKDSGVEWLSNKVPEHWNITTIKNIFRYFGSGSTPESSETKYYAQGTINWLNTTDIKNTFINETSRKITHLALKEKSLKIYPINTLAIAMYGQGDTRGNVGLLNIESTTNQAACMMYSTRNSIPPYMLWWFVCKKTNIRKINIGATQPNMNKDFIRNLFMSLPPLSEQKQIALFLDRKTAQIDRKIDLLTQKANKYEELKKSIINETVTRGLDKSVTMKDSGIEWIGKIPEHWQVKPLKDLAAKSIYSFVDGPFGSDLKSNEYIDKGVPLIQLNNIGVNIHLIKNIKFISEKKASSLSRHKAYPGEIAIAKMAEPVARATIIADDFSMYIVVADCMRLKPNHYIVNAKFLTYGLNTIGVKSQAEILSNGTTRIRINLSTAKILKVGIPPLPEQKAIARYLDEKTAHCNKIITNINQQIEKLKELRKTLINDVVTGKIKVTE